MSKTIYLECNSGISGDMVTAALLDLGADEKVLMDVLNSLPVGGFQVKVSRVKKAGLDACDFNVILDKAHENHDHDMEYLYGSGNVGRNDGAHKHAEACEQGHDHVHVHVGGHEYTHESGHSHTHEHTHEAGQSHDHEHKHEVGHSHDHEHTHEVGHSHDHEHTHEVGHSHDHEHTHEVGHSHDHEHTHEPGHTHSHPHTHEHRGLPEIMEIIHNGAMTEHAKAVAIRIFEILADAESKAHGLPKDQVHFHEVGAVDSIVDIVAAAVCLDNLGITDVIIPQLNEGTGSVRCQHGILPVPVPAVANIAAAHGLTLHIMDRQGEFVTPTGAAIAAAIRTSERLPEKFVMKKIGLGAGKRNYEQPSLVRAILLEIKNEPGRDTIVKLESNIDDCTGETLGYVMERLFAAGARDVHYFPVFMKKNRPAYQINVICDEARVSMMEQIIFRETTTIGIRRIHMERSVLPRSAGTVNTAYGEVQVKVCEIPGECGAPGSRVYPEYESVAKLSRQHSIPYAQMYQLVVDACKSESL